MDVRIGKKYRLGHKIGSGSFGDIYHGINIETGQNVAVKMESVKSSRHHQHLPQESQIYKNLNSLEETSGGSKVKSKTKIKIDVVGIPQIHWSGVEGKYNVMVIDLLGPSLEDLFDQCGRRFTLKTVLMIADQAISRIEYMHSKSYIHCDIKSDNFLMGIDRKESDLYIIDYGLSKRYRDPETMKHIPYREGKSLTGTARYAAINTHLGLELSRRDDLESLGYVLLYFLIGSLPWQGTKGETKKKKYELICEKKIAMCATGLYLGSPSEFGQYLTYVRSLQFEDQPDYDYLRKLFRDLYIKEGFCHDKIYDWTK